jgi:hypothetical protein
MPALYVFIQVHPWTTVPKQNNDGGPTMTIFYDSVNAIFWFCSNKCGFYVNEKCILKKWSLFISKNKEMCNFIENIFHMIKAYLRSTWPHLKFSFWGKEKSLSERVMLVKSYPSYSRN